MSLRTERLGEAIKEAVAETVQREMHDPRIGFVTITRVEVTPDLSLARVYYTVLGGDEERRLAREGLASGERFLRSRVARAVRMRFVPRLEFREDESLEKAERIWGLMAGGGSEGAETAPEEGEGAGR